MALHPDERPVDARRERLYSAEREVLRPARGEGFRTRGRKFRSVPDMQCFVDEVTHDPWLREHYWPLGRRSWEREDTKASAAGRALLPVDTHTREQRQSEAWLSSYSIITLDIGAGTTLISEGPGFTIVLPGLPEGRVWAWNSPTLLHETAHWLTPADEPYHGAWFAYCLEALVRRYVSRRAALDFHKACKAHGVTGPLKRSEA